MKVLIIKRRFFLFILAGIMIGLGFWFIRAADLQTDSAPSPKKVAIVIDDFGGRAEGVQEMMALPYPLTFAVLPFEEFSNRQAEQAMKKGFEIIVHMPFEAFGADPRWYGKNYISTNSSPAEIRELINESFQIMPMAVGLSNHMGSKATSDPKVMTEVLKELKRIKRFYLDSKTTFPASTAPKIATELNLPFIQRDIFLDNTNSANAMRRQLKELMEQARSKGMAVGIGHVGQTGPALAAVLREELPKYEKEGFHFVPLTELIDKHNQNIVIGIDPGHGGIDSGTKWRNLLEKDLNLKFSQKLAQRLKKRGYKVVLTRETDELLTPLAHYSNTERPYKRDDLQRRVLKMKAAKASAIISIHANWSKSAYHRGPIAYYSALSPTGQKMAQQVQEHLNRVQPFRKLPKPCNCYILMQSEIPGIVVELGFLSNPDDRKLLQDDKYLAQLESAIISGLEEII